MFALRQYICGWCSPVCNTLYYIDYVSPSHGYLTDFINFPASVDNGDNVKKGDDIPVDNTVPAEVETGGSSQQAAPDATAVPNGKEPQEPSAKAARFMIWQQSYFISKNAFASMLVFF
ncbi:unnamed protein product [Brassica napus]|uniref:(rape) hypothetical protein n=1 Tax=Brassica napus TaxID=3708 RepID=A0A816QB61_BRANA|nr:unnamed protein product [Brassica napus]